MNRLSEIDLLRVVCVLLLVADHSFAVYAGFWPRPESVESIPAYYWLGNLCYSFMLPLWVFISGYLWGYQIYGLNRLLTLKQLAFKKAKKLLLPCYLFGLIYILYSNNLELFCTPKGVVSYLSGMKHLWFLPMLFWVFIFSHYIQKIRINDSLLLLILLVIHIFIWNVLSLGIGPAFYYLFYFQLGKIIYKRRNSFNQIVTCGKYLFIASLLFILIFPPLIIILEHVTPENVTSIHERFTSQILMHITTFPMEFIGVMISYGLACKYNHKTSNVSWIKYLAFYSFGIYIFHQFILMYLYFDLNVGYYINSYILPFSGFFLSFFLSLALTWLCLKNRFGKLLLS